MIVNIKKMQQENIIRDTKKYIIKVARQLFSEYGYLGVSMSDIAKKLNITKAALYYHFTGKAEIYKSVLDEVFSNLSLSLREAFYEKTAEEKIRKLIRNYLDFGFKEKNLINALVFKLSPSNSQIRRHIITLRERIAGLIQPLVEEALINKNSTKGIDSRLITSLLTGMMDGLILEYSFLNKKMNPIEISDQIIAILF